MAKSKKLVIAKAPRKKALAAPGLVSTCDRCGKPLGRTCRRDQQSAICAIGCGIVVRGHGSAVGETVRFYCSKGCADQ